MHRTLPLVAIAALVAACSSSPVDRKTSAQQAQPAPANGGQPGSNPDDPNATTGDPSADPEGEGPSDSGPGDGGGVGDCIFNRGAAAKHDPGWRSIAPLSTIGQTASHPVKSMLWTGHELLVFGDGVAASYQPSTDTWKALPDAPIGMRSSPVVELAGGTKLIVWGGGSAERSYNADGAVFDLCTATWSAIPAAPIVGRGFPSHAYATTTGELLVWGGDRHSVPLSDPSSGAPAGEYADGAAYDLKAGTWRMLADVRATLAVFGAFYGSAWTGTTMMMYGGGPNHGAAPSAGQAIAYDPSTDTWSYLDTPPIQPRQFGFEQAVALHGTTAATFFQGDAIRQPLAAPGDGATFDFATKTWMTIPVPDATAMPDPMRNGSGSAWIGERFFVWGGLGHDASLDASGAVFDPASRAWSKMPDGGPLGNMPAADDFATTLDGEALFWGQTMMIFRP